MMIHPPDRDLEARTAALKAADDWVGLGRELEAVDAAVLARTPRAAYAYGEALYRTGRPDDLAAFAGRFETAARADADPESTMRALNMAGIAAFELGRMEEATRSLDAVLELAHAEGRPEMLAPAANNLGAIADLQGRFDEALSYYRIALPLYEQADHPHGVAQTCHNLGLTYRALERRDEAVRYHERAHRVAGYVGYRPLVALALSARAECELDLGDVELAGELVERSLGFSRDCGDPVSEADALRVRGIVRCGRRELDQSLADFETAAAIAIRTGNALLHAETLRDRGACLLAHSRADEGTDLLRQAAEKLLALGAVAKAAIVERMRSSGI